MSFKKFIIRTGIKIAIIAIVSTIVITLLQTPVLTNQIALTQMENSDGLFIAMELYYKIAPIVRTIYYCIVVFIFASVAYDSYKFIKLKNKENSNYEKD